MPNRLSDAAQTERDAGKMPPSSPVEAETLAQSYDAAQAAQNVLKAALKWELARGREMVQGWDAGSVAITRAEAKLREAIRAYARLRLEADV